MGWTRIYTISENVLIMHNAVGVSCVYTMLMHVKCNFVCSFV